MKVLKYGLFGILLGEIVVLLQKDTKLKSKFKKKKIKSYEKMELVTKELVSVNKKVLKTIQKSDYQKTINSILEFFEIQEEQVQKAVKDIKKRSKGLDQDHIHTFIDSFNHSNK